jgi:hypothetical protein
VAGKLQVQLVLRLILRILFREGAKKPGTIITKSGEKMEKRKYPRMGIRSLSVDVSDGVGFFPGVVSDVSRVGLGMSDLSKRLNGDVKKMTIVVSARGEHFKMNVQPKWSTQDGPRKSVGVEIMSAPYGWTEFVMNFEPVFHDDVWGEVRL